MHVQVNVDGEPVYDTNFKFEVLPKRLRLHVPEPRLLTSSSQPEREKGNGMLLRATCDKWQTCRLMHLGLGPQLLMLMHLQRHVAALALRSTHEDALLRVPDLHLAS